MGKTKHEKSYVDFDKAYETNLIGLRGIIYFGVGLFLLIVITFGLMLFFLNVLENDSKVEAERNANPMAESGKDRLPRSPVRLQAAPGFGVQTKDGYVNLELMHPQAEWEVVRQEDEEIWKNGEKAADGTVIALPIDEAKKKLLQKNIGTASEQGEEIYKESKLMISGQSAGRVASDRIR